MPAISTCTSCGADCWTPPDDLPVLCVHCLQQRPIETTPAIPAEQRTSIPEGWYERQQPLAPTVQLDVPVGDRTYAVVVKDPGDGRSWGFYEVAGLVARLEQRERLADALRQVLWLADATEPSSVKAGQIALAALEAAEEIVQVPDDVYAFISIPANEEKWDCHGPYCSLCGGLGAAVEFLPSGLVKRVCEAGHAWEARPNEPAGRVAEAERAVVVEARKVANDPTVDYLVPDLRDAVLDLDDAEGEAGE